LYDAPNGIARSGQFPGGHCTLGDVHRAYGFVHHSRHHNMRITYCANMDRRYDNDAGDNMPTYHRRSIRLHNYDYAQPGAYFVTLCTHQRECLLGNIAEGMLRLSPPGHVIEECWQALPQYFHAVQLDAFVVMPNHVHGIICILEAPPADEASIQRHGAAPRSLTAIVGNFKTVSARRINQIRNTPGAAVWQRNYYEHIIRAPRELDAIRKYIVDNPLKWSLDHENPTASS
jgi:REP element-mobilizing transposase RayT